MLLSAADPFSSLLLKRTLGEHAYQVTLPLSVLELEASAFLPLGIELPFSLKSAIKKRQLEFLCGRYCAMKAMEELGLSPAPPVAMGEDRAPVWASDLVGSITHTQGWASAVVGRRAAYQGLGLDLEHEMPEAQPAMVKHICVDAAELSSLAAHLGCSEGRALTLIFSAKESFFKATYNRVQRYYGFHVARALPAGPGELRIELLSDLSSSLRAGASWPVNFRLPAERLIETLICDQDQV